MLRKGMCFDDNISYVKRQVASASFFTFFSVSVHTVLCPSEAYPIIAAQ